MFFKPAIKLLSRRPGKGTPQNRFLVTGRLSTSITRLGMGPPLTTGFLHLGTTMTLQKRSNMLVQLALLIDWDWFVHRERMPPVKP